MKGRKSESRPLSRTASTIALLHLREDVDFENPLNWGQQAVQQPKVGFSRQTFGLFGASTVWNSLPALAKLVLFNGNVADITWRRIVGGFIKYRNETERKEGDKLVRELPAVFGRIAKAVSNLDKQFLQICTSVDDIARLSLGGKAPKQARGLQAALDNIQAQLQKLASSTREARREMPAKEIAAHRRNLQKILASLDKSSQNQALIAQNLSEAHTRVKRLEELYQPPASASPTENN